MDNVLPAGSINPGKNTSSETSHAEILQKLEEINNRIKKIEEHLLVPLINNEEDKRDAIRS